MLILFYKYNDIHCHIKKASFQSIEKLMVTPSLFRLLAVILGYTLKTLNSELLKWSENRLTAIPQMETIAAYSDGRLRGKKS